MFNLFFYLRDKFLAIKASIKDVSAISAKSFTFLFHHPRLLILPLISFFLWIIFSSLMVIPWFKLNWGVVHQDKTIPIIILIALISFLIFFASFLAALSNMGICYYTINQFENKPITIKESFLFGLSRTKTLLQLAFMATIVRWFIALTKGKKGKSTIVSSALTLGWHLSTFFLIPIFIFEEDLGIIASFKRSAQLMSNNFGTSLTAVVIFNWVQFIIMGLAGALSIVQLKTLAHHPYFYFAFFPIIFIFVLCTLTILSTMKTIFKTATYCVATQRPTGTFDIQSIKAIGKSI